MCPNDNASCTKPLLPRRWDSLFDSEAGSDVVFIVGPEQWRFPGHRAVLAAANPVFQAMLDGPLATQDTTIPIEDIDGRAFDNILRYLYREEVHLQSISTALHTLYAAFKYQCGGLVRTCIVYLDSQLDHNSVLEIYRHIRVYADPAQLPDKTSQDINSSPENSTSPSAPPLEFTNTTESTACAQQPQGFFCLPAKSEDIPEALSYCSALHHNCLQYIDMHASKVLAQEQVEDLDLEVLRLIAERETLVLSSEIVLFGALDRWCNRECKKRRLELSAENRRSLLGHNTLFSVRYLLMSSEEFLAGPMQTGLLDQSETAVMLAHILHHPHPPNPPPHIVNILPRMLAPRSKSFTKAIPLSWRSTPRFSHDDSLTSPGDGSVRGSGRRWGKKKDSKKLRKKSKSCSPEREGLDGSKRSTGSCIVEYVFSALSCVFD